MIRWKTLGRFWLCRKWGIWMGKRRRHSSSGFRQPKQPKPQRPNGAPWTDPLTVSGDAIRTYLQQQIAIIRPQTSNVEMAHLARFGVTANAAVSMRAESLRQVDFILSGLDRQPLPTQTPVQAALKRMFANNFPSVIERMEWSYCYFGEILLQKLYDANHLPVGLEWLNNLMWMIDTSHWDGLRGFRVRAQWGSDIDPDLAYLPVEDAVYAHTVDFWEDFGGIGPVQVAYVQAATETEMAATQLQFFRNMAMPSYIFQPAKDDGFRPGLDQKNELTEYLRRMYQGAANAGRTLVMPTRWETLKLQQDFDKLGMPDLSEAARQAVLRILRVPLELLEPHQASRTVGTKFYDQKREWLISWLVPQAERYANVFTEQIAKLYNPDWLIVPSFDRVRGLEEDIGSRTETVSKQVADSLLDIYSAQEILGIDPDVNLRGMYMVSGVPVPVEAIRTYYMMAPGSPGIGAVLGGEHGKEGTPETHADKPHKPTETTDETRSEDLNQKSAEYLSDAAYREWKSWRYVVERKGPEYDFVAKSLPVCVVAYGKLLLRTSGPTEDNWTAIRLAATKDYGLTESLYRTALYTLITDAFDGRLDREQFGVAGRDEISTAFANAFLNGLDEGGVALSSPDEMDDDEVATLKLEVKAERGFWTAFANELYKEVIPLKGSPAFETARTGILSRVEIWVRKGLNRVRGLGVLAAKANQMLLWRLGETEEHCESCIAANGQIHRARDWARYVTPNSDELICGGWHCDCRLEPTTSRASGSLQAIPLGAAKHVHGEPDDVRS